MIVTRLSRAWILVYPSFHGYPRLQRKGPVVAPASGRGHCQPSAEEGSDPDLEFTGTTAALEFVEIRARVEDGWRASILQLDLG